MLQPKIVEVKPLDNYKLFLVFDTNEEKIFDVTPYILGEWYEKLLDIQYFNTVHVSGNTVEWEGGQDIAPHELYELAVNVNSQW